VKILHPGNGFQSSENIEEDKPGVASTPS
jgi:hypothetical protein